MSTVLRQTPIHRSGNRVNLFMGGDRELVMFGGLLAFALIFIGQEPVALVFGVLLWFGDLYLCRLMAKSDTQMREVYMRHRAYKSFYSARSTPFRKNSGIYGRKILKRKLV